MSTPKTPQKISLISWPGFLLLLEMYIEGECTKIFEKMKYY